MTYFYRCRESLKLFLSLALFVFMQQACVSTSEELEDTHEDFSLWEPDKQKEKLGSGGGESMISLPSKSLLPVSVRVGRGADTFRKAPKSASNPKVSHIGLQKYGCKMIVSTGNVEVFRYLWTGDWIRVEPRLPSDRPVKLQPGMDFFFQFAVEIDVRIPKAFLKRCRQMFEGSTQFVGFLTLGQTKVSMKEAPRRSPKVGTMVKFRQGNQKAFCDWNEHASSPTMVDELGTPLILNSPIYHTKFDAKGFYYLLIGPWLELAGKSRQAKLK